MKQYINRLYYLIRPLIPRSVQIGLRRSVIKKQRKQYNDIWPISKSAATPPDGWQGWPDGKKFAVVLTHDVEKQIGHDRCEQLMRLEKKLQFRSSFNFVPERYNVSPGLRQTLESNGFEVGVHGLLHDGKLYKSYEEFLRRSKKINHYIDSWKVTGFRSPAMHHQLDWLHHLQIQYDASTFDTDPFEPQSDGVDTIFPFWVPNNADHQKGYVELPYTLAQDFTLFILMQEKTIDIWQQKIRWVVENGGMVLVNVHPDYMCWDRSKQRLEEFPYQLYEDLLNFISRTYEGQYWNPLPKELADFWMEKYR